MDSTSEFDVSSYHSPSPDLVPSLELTRITYTTGWVLPKIVQRHAGAALLHGFFETPKQRQVVVFVPTKEYWQIVKSQLTQRILQVASFWCFFRLKPRGPDYRRAWELQCSLERDGQATMIGFYGHPLQFTITRQMVREALHTSGVSIQEGNLAPYEKKTVTSQERLTFASLKHKEISLAL